MEELHVTGDTCRSLWRYLYAVVICTACIPQLLSAAPPNRNHHCTSDDKHHSAAHRSHPAAQSYCSHASRRNGRQNTIIIEEQDVINVAAIDGDETIIAIDGSRRRDNIINYGEVHLQVTNTGSLQPSWLYWGQADGHHDKARRKKHGHKQSGNWLSVLNYISPYAIGIAGGRGNDIITNYGLLDVSAITNLTDEAGLVQTSSIGITGDKGNDQLVNEGQIIVTAGAVINIDDVDFDLLETGDVQRQARAIASEMIGDKGHDEIINRGQLAVTSNAKVDTTKVNVALIGGAVDIDSSSEAWAAAIGLDGGDGHDHILNQGSTTVNANASVNSTDVGISLISALQGEDIRAPIDVKASAIGIDGGRGHDEIENMGSLTVTADARADALDMDFSAVDISSGSMSTTSEASVMGIDGGKGKSEVHNIGNITVHSNATTDTKSVAFTLVDLTLIPDIINLINGTTAVDTATTSTADATGIKTGYDHDQITNDGSLSVTADAITNTFEMQMSADGVSNLTELEEFADFFFAEPLIDAGTTAEASVIGITSGHGHDQIDNSGSLFAKAGATVTANSVGVDIPFPDLIPPVLPNIDTTEVETAANAQATGIVTGEGHDKVQNEGSVWSEAVANATSLSVRATVGAPVPGLVDYNIPYSLEGNLVDVGARSEAAATGIMTGGGHDTIYSPGDITSKATSTASATDIGATVAYADDKVALGVALNNASTEGRASTVGVNSGSGNDWLYNAGTLLADAFINSNSTAVEVDLQVQKDTVISLGASVTRANTEAETNSVGIDLGEGHDAAYNEGSITAKAHNNLDAVGVDVGITIPTGDEFGIIGEGNWVTTDSLATSFADGVLGGDGRDEILNTGSISADAFADPNSVSVAANASGTKKGASIGVALTQAKTEGTATSNGVRGDQDEDKLVNSGTVSSRATTDADAVAVSVSLGLTDKGVALTGTAADGSTNATSTANGMTGGEAEDLIRNEGTVDALANADAETVTVSVAAQGASQGVALGLALSRATAEANANSLGIGGGSHDDVMYSFNLIKSHAKANVVAGSGGLAAGGTGKGVSIEGAAADGSTTGNATASGVTGDEGEDQIVNGDLVDVLAKVNATSVSVAASASGTGTGVTFGIGLARASSEGTANSSGISGGDDSDVIASSGTVKSHAVSTVVAGSGALAGGGTGKGVTLEGAAADGLTKGFATAAGITGDSGNDILHSEGELDVYSEANTISVSVAVSANGTGTGVSADVALARATSEAEANSTGISGGGESDTISNTNLLKAHAKADVDAVSVSAAMGGTGTGVAIGGAAADAATIGTANSTGINGGTGSDEIYNKGTLDVLADAAATSTSVGVSVSGTGTGVGLGISLARADTRATANATGISLGGVTETLDDDHKSHRGKKRYASYDSATNRDMHEHDDDRRDDDKSGRRRHKHHDAYDHDTWETTEYLENYGKITAKSVATANSVSVSAQLGITGTGLQAGGALVDAGTDATANATGIEGSEHQDIILNHNSIDAISDADANTTSVAVSLNVSLEGATLSAAISDATATASAQSIGISGLKGDDQIHHQGAITATSRAETDAVSVSVPFGISFVPLGVGIADTTTTADADAIGLDGGLGQDYLESVGSILVDADSKVDGISVSAAPIGVSFVGANITADSTAVGMQGASGNDLIYQTETASLTATSRANATGTVVSATLLGTAGTIIDDNNSTASSQSTGISGGAGGDQIENLGTIYAGSNATATGTSIGVDLAGAALADLSTTATSKSTGIDTGNDDDKVINEGAITGHATSLGEGTSVAAGLVGYFDGDANTTVDATASSIQLGEGNDILLNKGSLNIGVKSNADLTAGSGSLAGVSSARSNITATVFARGIAGGVGQDLIINEAAVTVGPVTESDPSMSRLTSTNFSLNLAGVTAAESALYSSTRSIGIDGEQDDDQIYNAGQLNIYASSYNSSSGTSIGIFGTSSGGGISGAIAEATGIDGGEGYNKIENTALIGVISSSYASVNATSFTFGGTGEAEGSMTASALSVGLSGGNDKDSLLNQGAISVAASSKLESDGSSITPFGTSGPDFTVGAKTNAIGIDGGTGENLIANLEQIDVTASSTVNQTGSSFTFGGTSEAGGTLNAATTATGIRGDVNGDEILNEAAIVTTANSTLISSGGSVTPFGTSDTKPTSGAVTTATGIDAGHGNNIIKNLSLIDVNSDSSVSISGSSFTFGGTGEASGKLTATTSARGIVSGDGIDAIRTEGTIDIDASASLSSRNKSTTIFGTADSGTTSGAEVTAYGIDSGAGSDFIHSLSLIDITAKAEVSLDESSYSFGGTSGTGGRLAAQANAVGISGGADADDIQSEQNILVDATSILDSTGNTSATFGTSGSDTKAGAIATVEGISGGEGDDRINNLATINITSTSTVNSNRSAYTFGGGSSSDSVMTGETNSTGISGGIGLDEIYNKGVILVNAISNLTATAGTESTFGGSDASGLSSASATVQGIDGAEDDDFIINEGRIEVTAFADATATNNAESGWLTGDGTTGSITKASVNAFGIAGGSGENYIHNKSDVKVTSQGVGYAFAYASGAHLSWDGDGEALSESNVDSTATGISAGDGNNYIVNEGRLTILAEASTVKTITTTIRFWSEEEDPDENNPPAPITTFGGDELPTLPDENYPPGETIFWTEDPMIGDEGYVAAWRNVINEDDEQVWVHINGYIIEKTITLDNSETYAAANGNGVTGTGKATASGYSNASAYGIQVGDGDNKIINLDEINVTASPEALTHVSADGDAFGDAIGTTESEAKAVAIGISAGSGNNWIKNAGTINVLASPRARSHSEVSGGDICIWFFGWWCGGGGDGIGSASATFDSLAVGIMTAEGAGENKIINNGILNITAGPLASGFTTKVEGDGSPEFATEVRSKAVGIWTRGSGDSRILNTGEINVTASDVPIGYSCSGTSCLVDIEAVGIWTGSGDDYILNKGSINVTAGGDSPIEVAIRSGSGDDVVVMAESSSVTGDIELGENDDILHIFNSPVINGRIYGGNGVDTAVYEGSGTFDNPLEPDFENTVKTGEGTYTLNSLPPMQNITVEQGVLEINSDYVFAVDSSFMPAVSSGEGQGELVINGEANISAVEIKVVKGRGHHMDGETQTVLYASQGIINTMTSDNISLPEKTPLLAFDQEVTSDEVRINTSVKPFESVATTQNQHVIANYMDNLLANAEGDISLVLGEIQATRAGGHARAFNSLNPESYVNTQQALETGFKNYTETLRKRMRGLRNTKHYNNTFVQPGFLVLPDQDNRLVGKQTAADLDEILNLARNMDNPYDVWARPYTQYGQLDQTSVNNGFGFDTEGYALGFDKWLDNERIIGMSMGTSLTNVDVDNNRSHSNVDSQLFSLYSGYVTGSGYAESSLHYGYNDYGTLRNVTIGQINTMAFSEHESFVYGATAGGGLFFPVKTWDLEVYGVMQYLRQEEEGFQESGAGGISLNVASRKVDLLSTELGFHIGKQYKTRSSSLYTEFGAAWLHEFNEDSSIEASFVDAPNSSFVVNSQDIDDNGLLFNAGLSYKNRSGFSGAAEYRTEIRDGYTDQIISANIRYQFD